MFPNPFIEYCYGPSPEAVGQQLMPLDTFDPEAIEKCPVEYVCFYTGPDFNSWPMEKGTFLSFVASLLAWTRYGIERTGFGLLILKRGRSLTETLNVLDINISKTEEVRSAIWRKLLDIASISVEDLSSFKGAQFVKAEEGFLAPEIAFSKGRAKTLKTTKAGFIIGPIAYKPDDLLSLHTSWTFLLFLPEDEKPGEVKRVLKILRKLDIEVLTVVKGEAKGATDHIFTDSTGEVFEAYNVVREGSQGFLINPYGIIVWKGRAGEVLEFLRERGTKL